MLKNMFKTAWRSALRQKQFSLLNILGLSIGITTCLFIGLYVQDELSYDSFHKKADRIYRVEQPMIWGDWNERMSAIGPNVALALAEEAPEFEALTRVFYTGFYIVNHQAADGKIVSFKENRVYTADDNFFDIFSFEFVQGDPAAALKGPGKMVITESMAQKYFGNEDPIGKTIQTKFSQYIDLFTVSAVVKDSPASSHIQFDFINSMESFAHIKDQDWKWIWTGFTTYGLVKPNTDIKALTEKIQAVPPKYAGRTTETIFNQSFEDFTAGHPWSLFLTQLEDIYLDRDEAGNALGPVGDIRQIQVFTAIGLLTLLLSCINFMNLSTARSANRSKEVGIRKVLGSQRKSLVRQFMLESVLFAFTSMVIAIILTELSIGAFNDLASKQLSLDAQLTQPATILVLLSFVLVIGFIAGSYPAFYLSSFKPIASLKGKIASGFKGKGIRNGLVIFQFTISIALVICAFFVQKQLAFTSSFDMGYDRNNLFQLHNIEQFEGDVQSIRTALESNPVFSAIGHSNALPPEVWSGDRYKATGTEEVLQLSNMKVDEGYLPTLNPTFLAGRNFDKNIVTDKYGIILNETAVKALGWGTVDTFAQDSPIGKSLSIASGDEYGMHVIGVVKDFNFNSLKNEINPLVILHMENDKVWDYNSGVSFFSMRLNTEAITSGKELQEMIAAVKENVLELDPAFSFEYSFMDQAFDRSFRSEQKMGKVLNVFTFMAIAIACLGLFGLAAFSAEQRRKELGVRKVLGAKALHLMMLFSSEFTKLVALSLVVATPIAYLAVDTWLAGFAYKTAISPVVFIVAGLVAMLIAWSTISSQSLKAAYRNPVEALRDE